MTMPQQSRDKPDPKNILSEDQKRKGQATKALTPIIGQQEQLLNPTKLKVSAIESKININKSLPGLWIVPPLKISIPKDASMPDRGAVENGALLSASDLEKCGYFVNSLVIVTGWPDPPGLVRVFARVRVRVRVALSVPQQNPYPSGRVGGLWLSTVDRANCFRRSTAYDTVGRPYGWSYKV